MSFGGCGIFRLAVSEVGNGRSEGKSLNGRREPQPLINKDMMIKELLASNENANISVTVSVADLKEFAMFLIDEVQTAKAVEQKPEEYLTPQEVAEKLKVSTNTLWRWNNTKYLCHVKVGRKPFYRKSDVMKIMEG